MSQTSQYSPVKYLELKQPEFSYNPAFYTDGFGAGLYPVSKWDSRKTDISPSEKRLKHFFFFFFFLLFFFFFSFSIRVRYAPPKTSKPLFLLQQKRFQNEKEMRGMGGGGGEKKK